MKIKDFIFIGIVLTLLGCDNKQVDSKNIINSYLTNVRFELSSYSKPIKKQVITGNRKEILEAYPDGFFKSFDLQDLNVLIDYSNRKCIFDAYGNTFEYKINLDEKNNIVSMEDPQGNQKLLATFDEQKRVIKIENSGISDDPFIYISHFFYQNNVLIKSSLEIRQKLDESISFPINFRETEYFYNNQKQLHKSIEYTYYNSMDKPDQGLDNQQHPDKQETCVYDDYNQYGDWTKLYCLDENNVTTKFNLRTIEYY